MSARLAGAGALPAFDSVRWACQGTLRNAGLSTVSTLATRSATPMVKFALLVSQTPGAATLQILMRAVVVAGPVTVHGCELSFGVFPKRSVHVGVVAVALRDT